MEDRAQPSHGGGKGRSCAWLEMISEWRIWEHGGVVLDGDADYVVKGEWHCLKVNGGDLAVVV